MCQGSISTHFFSGDSVDLASVIFLLYYLSKNRDGETQKTLIGFALVNDLRKERGEDEDTDPGTLYIDAICTNTDIRATRDITVKGAGQLLMNQIEDFANRADNYVDGEPYTNIKLSALPYVIGYYRKLGYRHIHNCKDLVMVDGELVESDKDIAAAVKKVEKLKTRFSDDEKLEMALLVELAKNKKILATGKDGKREKTEYLIGNLNDYFKGKDIIFMRKEDSEEKDSEEKDSEEKDSEEKDSEEKDSSDADGEIVAIDKDTSKENEFVNRLLSEDNSDLLDFINTLRRKKFSVACRDNLGRYLRHNFKRDTDGEIDFHCRGEGYTMRKCLKMSTVSDSSQSGGGGRQHKKKRLAIAKVAKVKAKARLAKARLAKARLEKKCLGLDGANCLRVPLRKPL